MSDKLDALKKLLRIDTSDPSRGIQISLPQTPQAEIEVVQSEPPRERPRLQYPITIVNGRIIRESRHPDSEYAGWAMAIGPDEADLEKKIAHVRAQSGPPVRLDDLEYAVVDTETTGGGIGHRITEIAIVRVNARGDVLHEYSTLVNPGRRIPAMITALTHIDNDMVRSAPRFKDIAQDVRALLNGRVFVAHNAAFDWGFVTDELIRTTGAPLYGRKLCTVRLARKVVPELRSRSLVHADRLAERTGAAVRVAVLHGDSVTIVHHVFRPDAGFGVPEVGSQLPAHASALGKVMGPSFSAAAIPEVIEHIVQCYLDNRALSEGFIETVERIGLEPFKARVYAQEATA